MHERLKFFGCTTGPFNTVLRYRVRCDKYLWIYLSKVLINRVFLSVIRLVSRGATSLIRKLCVRY